MGTEEGTILDKVVLEPIEYSAARTLVSTYSMPSTGMEEKNMGLVLHLSQEATLMNWEWRHPDGVD